jgi:small conductance mechanosensitive channel
MFDYTTIMTNLEGYFFAFAPKLFSAILILILGFWIVSIIVKFSEKNMKKSKMDSSLRPFLLSFLRIILKVLVIITAISMLGIQMTSFIAVLGAAGLAVGLALQGSLANFAGGVLILLFKPFKVGDFIEAQGHSGTVKEIQVFNTIMKTPDNKTIIIPNGALSNNSVINYSTEPTRRVDLTFGIGYGDDISKSRKVIESLILKDKRVLKDPSYNIFVKELGSSSVDFTVRVWTKAEDYWGFYFDMQENVKLEFDKNNISIPFPQRDVHLYKH